MLNITKLYDQPGWCYDFIGREMKKYSKCRFTVAPYNNFDYTNQDIILISGPDIAPAKTAIEIPKECKKRGIKVIGQYCGEVDVKYEYADLIVTISPQTYLYAKNTYKDTPVIFLPESIDTNYWKGVEKTQYGFHRFTPGWAGGAGKSFKRVNLFSQLRFPVTVKSDHGQKFFKEGRTQISMQEFYNNIDVFISMSSTECLPRVILEAMACGLPVVATNVGGVRLLIPDEWMIPAFPESTCVEEMNNRLQELASSFELRLAMGRINRAWCERCWSWEANMPIWDEVFYYLHKGNTEKILEIGESVIAPFKKFFTMTDEYKKQIENFRKQPGATPIPQGKNTIFVPGTEQQYERIVANLVKDLQRCHCNYWLARESCLDTINKQRILTTPGNVYLGVNNPADKKILIDFLKFLGAREAVGYFQLRCLKVYVITEPVKQTKIMTLYNLPVNVPMPVVQYLEEQFGQEWKKL